MEFGKLINLTHLQNLQTQNRIAGLFSYMISSALPILYFVVAGIIMFVFKTSAINTFIIQHDILF